MPSGRSSSGRSPCSPLFGVRAAHGRLPRLTRQRGALPTVPAARRGEGRGFAPQETKALNEPSHSSPPPGGTQRAATRRSRTIAVYSNAWCRDRCTVFGCAVTSTTGGLSSPNSLGARRMHPRWRRGANRAPSTVLPAHEPNNTSTWGCTRRTSAISEATHPVGAGPVSASLDLTAPVKRTAAGSIPTSARARRSNSSPGPGRDLTSPPLTNGDSPNTMTVAGTGPLATRTDVEQGGLVALIPAPWRWCAARGGAGRAGRPAGRGGRSGHGQGARRGSRLPRPRRPPGPCPR